MERSEDGKGFAIRVCEGLQRKSFHRQPVASRELIPRKTKVITSKSCVFANIPKKILKSTFTYVDGNWKTVFSGL